jgi:hypothetical protein
MFNKDFFPTPFEIAYKMIDPYRWMSKPYILEPSVWKWDIAKVIKNAFRDCKIFWIESEPELAQIAKEHCTIIWNDFLEFQTDIDFDLIIMNPPFSNWDEHFLKAWETIKNWSIACLLNSETINNPYSEKRKLIQKIIHDNNWTIEQLWSCFVSAERKTWVEVVLVRVSKVTDRIFQFGWFEADKVDYEEIRETWIATLNKCKNIVELYQKTKEQYAQWVALIRNAHSMANSIAKNYELKPFEIANECWTVKNIVQNYTDKLKYWIWNMIFEELNIWNKLTSKVKADFMYKLKEQWNVAISEQNIQLFVQAIFENWSQIMEQVIIEVFDIFTRYYDENRFHVEWWKTNDKWKVNKKIILPNYITYEKTFDSFHLSYHRWSGDILDIDRCMAHIMWKDIKQIKTLEQTLRNMFNEKEMTWESEFFKIKIFKKGTLHIEFMDHFLWQEFNMRATSWKKWLPEREEKAWKMNNKFI